MPKELYLHSFYVDLNQLPDMKLYSLAMPQSWRDFILQNKKRQYEYGFRLKSLGEKLQSTIPFILSCHYHSGVIQNGAPWIIASEPIDTKMIIQMSLHWFAHMMNRTIQNLPKSMYDVGSEFRWHPFSIQENKVESLYYNLIPGIFAHHFSKEVVYFKEIDRQLKFYHVHNNGVHECMSEPIPIQGKNENDRIDYYSYVMRIKLVTRGLENKFCLNVKVVIRRFITQPLVKKGNNYLPKRHDLTVFLSIKNPYKEVEKSYVPLKISRAKEKGRFSKWRDDVDQTYVDLIFGQGNLSSDELLLNPEEYFHSDTINALLVYSPLTVRKRTTRIAAGAGLRERRGLFTVFKERYPFLQQLPPLAEIKTSRFNKSLRKPWLPHPSVYTSGPIILEVWSDDRLIYDRVKQQLSTLLEVTPVDHYDGSLFIKEDLETGEPYQVKLVRQPLQGITNELDRRSKEESRIQKRVNEIVKRLGRWHSTTPPVLALVEIHEPEEFEDKKAKESYDPKDAIRLGMLKTGRITQFIHPLKEDDKMHRVTNGILDLLTDGGFLHGGWKSGQKPIEFIGFTFLKMNRERDHKRGILPIWSWFRPDMRLLVKIYGESQWLPFGQAILNLNRYHRESSSIPFIKTGNDNEGVLAFQDYICKELEKILIDTSNPVYLYVAIEHDIRRKWWKEIANKDLNGGLPFHRLVHGSDRLRVIRINTEDEVPYYDIKEGKRDVTRSSGLFVDPNGIYYSVGMRPDSLMGLGRVEDVKITSPMKTMAKQKAVEVIPLGCSPDERDQIARITHELRNLNLTYEFHTILPFPLHILKTVKKYLQLNNGMEFDEGWFEDFEEMMDELDEEEEEE